MNETAPANDSEPREFGEDDVLAIVQLIAVTYCPRHVKAAEEMAKELFNLNDSLKEMSDERCN